MTLDNRSDFLKKQILSVILAFSIIISTISAFAYDPNWWATDTVGAAMRYSLISTYYGDKPYTDPITRVDFINVSVNVYTTITA